MEFDLMWIIVEAWLGLEVERSEEYGTQVASVLSFKREELGIAPFVYNKDLEELVKMQAYFGNLGPESPHSLTKLKANEVFKGACELFKVGCEGKSAYEFIEAIGVKTITTKLKSPREVIEDITKYHDVIFSRGAFGCEPWSDVAGVVQSGQFHLALFPASQLNKTPPKLTSLRPVDFCKDKLVAGMEAYWVPDPYMEYRILYNLINVYRTNKNLRPFMFSKLLSDNGIFHSTSTNTLLSAREQLLCLKSDDVACVPFKATPKPLYQIYKYVFPLTTPNEELITITKSIEREPFLTNPYAREQQCTIGFTKSDKGLHVRIVATKRLHKPTSKLCRRTLRLIRFK
ncbi:hypothetical protein L0F63_004256 [Massospora cicadina]|nr:hypothetical protein L0F63_004256 [Massospora cicadina]